MNFRPLAVSLGCLVLSGAMSFAQIGRPGAPPGPPPTHPGQIPGQNPELPPGEQPGHVPDMSQSHARDKMFVRQAIEGNLAEIEMGQLALDKSSDAHVRQFAQKMVTDHSRLNETMEMQAHRLQVPVPSQPSKKQRGTKKKLQALSGEDFDHAYAREMVADHKKDLRAYQEESTATQDAELRSVVMQAAEVIQGHLTQAEQLAKSLKTEHSSH